MSQQGQQGDEGVIDTLIIPIFILIVVVVVSLVYDGNRYEINSVFIAIAKGLLYPLSFIPETKSAINQLSEINPGALGFDGVFNIFNYAGRLYSLLLIPVALYFIYQLNKEEILTRYSRKFDLMSLIKNNAEILPFLKPIANRSRSILEEDSNKGAWASPRQPAHWIAHNQLLLDKNNNPFPIRFMLDKNEMSQTEPLKTPLLSQSRSARESMGAHIDVEKTKKLLLEQLGEKLETDKSKLAYSLTDYEAGVVAALLGYGLGDKEKGYEYICIMGTSFVEGVWDEETKTASGYKLDIGDAREYITKTLTSDDLDESLLVTFSLHGTYKYCWLMSLIENYAGEKGVFNSALYIFLRPTDNRLFLALNQVGGETGWIEAFGIWTHYEVEKTGGYTLAETDYTMELAISNLNSELSEAGWIGNNPEVYK